MPTKRALLERLTYEVKEKGEGENHCFYQDMKKLQAERVKNNARVTRFVLGTEDPDLCAEFHRERDRIMRRVHNKAVAMDLMLRMWRGLSDAMIDRILAEEG
jgi:hypothetical protein